jgi:ATP/maltotriose-dependent transcriptional regulator MalT
VSEALYRYFAEEVVRGLSEDEAHFMLLASVPPSLNERIATSVIGIEHGAEMIERLTDEGLLQSVGPSRLELHPLLRAFLRQRLHSEEPVVWRQLCGRAIADARDESQWEDAFELSIYAGELALATEILEKAATEMLAGGRVETLERWLEECGATAVEHPGALLVRAEILTRHGQLGESSTLAEAVAGNLPAGHPLASRANYVAGQASYLRSRSDLAAPYYRRAVEDAQTDTDRKNALWGAFLAHADLDIEASTKYLSELELQAEDLNTRLRATVARQTVASERGALTGLWTAAHALLPLARHAKDPLVRSNFLAQSSYLAVARSHYSAALSLVDEALELTSALHHDFATACCLAYRASAKIGLRQLLSASNDLLVLAQTSAHWEDPYLQTQRALTDARLSIAQADLPSARRKLEEPARGAPSSVTQGEREALLALVLASLGSRQAALNQVERARTISQATEARFLSAFAEVIAKLESGNRSDEAFSVVKRAFEADYTDSFVVAYRAFPRLLKVVSENRERTTLVSPVIRSANDLRLARRMGMKLVCEPARNQRQLLTAREEEVLELLGLGLSNSDIAQRLFIARSTVKVHVHHILEKLGVQNRVQAALIARRED